MGSNYEKSENKAQDVPLFEIGKKGRMQLSIYKMTTGFMVMDQDTEDTHSLTSAKDIRTMLVLTGESLVDTVIAALNDKKEKEFVDITLIVETKQEVYEPPQFDYSQPPELGFEQLAEIVNKAIMNQGAGGLPFNLGRTYTHGRQTVVTAQDIQRAMMDSGAIKVKTRFEASPTENTAGKKFYDNRDKNKGQNRPQDQGKGGGDKGNIDESKPHKVE